MPCSVSGGLFVEMLSGNSMNITIISISVSAVGQVSKFDSKLIWVSI